MKKILCTILLTAYVAVSFCQDTIKISLDTVYYATLKSFEKKGYVIINIDNNTSTDYIFWIAECIDSSISYETKKKSFFFQSCGNREYNLFQYLTDNWPTDYSTYYIGFSFIKRIYSRKTFSIISSIENVSAYLKRFIIMSDDDFRNDFFSLKSEWLFKYDILVLDNLEQVEDIEVFDNK